MLIKLTAKMLVSIVPRIVLIKLNLSLSMMWIG
jgi:hypothetical protein